ncbi:protein disulfide isomerase family protein [bacterium]|nr:protein disulfide isomerase family protein [bacterium]
MKESRSFFSDSNFVKELAPKDFQPYQTWKLRNKECSIVLFYCPWCPHCVKIKDLWNTLGQVAGFLNVYAFNCEKYKAHELKIKEENKDVIKGYPTILVYKGGVPVRRIKESERTLEDLLKVCMNQKQ